MTHTLPLTMSRLHMAVASTGAASMCCVLHAYVPTIAFGIVGISFALGSLLEKKA